MATIVLQAGHCHRRSGSTGTASRFGGLTEQQYAWAVALRARDLLAEAGHDGKVITADPALAAYRGDGFVAIHCDGSTNASVRGSSVGYRTAAGKALAEAFKAAYHRRGWPGGFRPDNYTAALQGYYGTRRAIGQGNQAAFIIECGFMTNAADDAALHEPAPGGVDRVARSIVDAVVACFGGHAPTPTPTVTTLEDDRMFVEQIEAQYLRLHGATFNARKSDRKGWNYWMDELAKAAVAKGAAGCAAVVESCRKIVDWELATRK